MNTNSRLRKLENKLIGQPRICDCPEIQRVYIRFPGEDHYVAVPPATCETCQSSIAATIVQVEFETSYRKN